jgi:hypothetical protein
MRTRDETWIALDSRHKCFMDCIGQLTEEELTTTPVCGVWTAKDVIAHVWSWLEEAVRTARAWHEDRPWQHDVVFDDAWNETQVADHSLLPLITVVESLTGAHRRLMHLLDTVSDEDLAEVALAPWGEQMSLLDFIHAMSEHYEEHAQSLRAFQDRCLNCG